VTVNLTVYGQSDVGLVRATNEDAFVIADLTGGSIIQERIARFEVGLKGVLLAVSDGLGGHQAGEVASALVVESLRRSMIRLLPSVPTRTMSAGRCAPASRISAGVQPVTRSISACRSWAARRTAG